MKNRKKPKNFYGVQDIMTELPDFYETVAEEILCKKQRTNLP